MHVIWVTVSFLRCRYFEDSRGLIVKTPNPTRQLTDEEIWAAISYLGERVDDNQFSANVAVIVLLVSIVIAMVTLVLHVALS